ncbi:MAG: hypothetical protein JHC37_01780 [Campylobacteraceae bacterium]|nr:hypothetical protein [Campylobacteraceae bacterium]
MFGLVLKFQAFMEKLRKNKGMWFTTITTLSFFGIVVTLYYLNSMTTRAAKNLYEATNASYFYELDTKITDSTQKLELIGNMLLLNQAFVAVMNNTANADAIAGQIKSIGDVATSVDKNPIILELFGKNAVKIASSSENPVLDGKAYDSKILQKAIATGQPVSGIEYQDGAVFLIAAYPLQNSVLEIKKSMDYLVDIYAANDKIFQVLMDKDFVNMQSAAQFKHQKIGKSEVSFQSKTDSDFLQKIAELDFEKLIANKYMLSDEYFILAKPIMNVEGKKVGVVIVGENILKNNGLPRMVKGISIGLTTAALGLVVALLVFMV